MSNSNSFKLRFRLLVLLSVALYVGWFLLPYVENRVNSQEMADLLTWSGYGALFGSNVLAFLAYGCLLAYGIICVGLIYFKSWARECFVLLMVIVLALSFVYGVSVLSEVSIVYLQVMNIIDGLIIALIYFSALSKEFDITHNKRMQTDRPKPASRPSLDR